ETQGPAGRPKVVETLRGVFVGQAFHALQLHHKLIFDKDIREVFSHRVALVTYCQEVTAVGADATKAEFCEESLLVYLLEESGAPSGGNFEDGGEHFLAQGI